MANSIEDSVFQAMDILINNRVSNLALDKTITCTIVSATNLLADEYKVQYQGGYLTAYAQDGESYRANQTVYVLVPEGNFSNKKLILGKAVLSGDDANISFVSSAMSDYNMIGKNVISDDNNILPAKLHSYLSEDYVLLYDRDSQQSYLTIDVNEFNNYLRESEALMIEASFQTRLPKAHKISKTGVYGLQFILAFNDLDETDEEGNPAIKYLSYNIDVNSMTGNPFNYTTYSDQYSIFPIDIENFLYIDTILFYSNGFVTESDTVLASDADPRGWGADIFVKDLEIYGLKKITGTNGDYRLSISMPQGGVFKTILSSESLNIIARTTYQINQDISDSTTYYWFAEDSRITSTSENYQYYGGAGWRRLDKGSNYNISLYGNENKAYENKYLCVAVYKESVILKEYFTIYNEAAKRDIEISSDLGVKFAFDRGTPTLTCLVNGYAENFDQDNISNPKPDSYYKFVWSKTDIYGSVLLFNETYEELKQEYEDALADANIGYAEIVSIKTKMSQMQNVTFERWTNKISYPLKGVDNIAYFKCNVFLKDSENGEEYSIGSAEITLQNETTADNNSYSIIIENGDQVFQYSESGVTPCSDRYKDPQTVLPLSCHFYDPAGLEVNSDTYSLSWIVPLTDTLITTPAEGMSFNPVNNKLEIYQGEYFPLRIAETYDYSALNNQVTCVVDYKGEEFTKDTRLYFGKVGDNGTNGTDVVAVIKPITGVDIPNNEMLTIEIRDGETQWNSGQTLSEQILDFNLYQNGEQVVVDSVTWSIAGNRTSYMNIAAMEDTTCAVGWGWSEAKPPATQTQVVKGSTTMTIGDTRQTYYAYYGIPVIKYHGTNVQHIGVDYTGTIKDIIYNSDGRNPSYNKNQGVKLVGNFENKFIVWYAEGGNNGDNPNFGIKVPNGTKYTSESTYASAPQEIYIIPDDIYDGDYSNNLVHGVVYSSANDYTFDLTPEADIYVPINMMLNTYGLASLNAWDGQHIEVNEDGNYILAPQIGAGSKNSKNQFTGIVMGTAEVYDNVDNATKPSVFTGLLGYSEGKQSIGLDAETGKAVFGLPEDQASSNNAYTEGRIELVPGGTSKIGMWNIGSRAIYNMNTVKNIKTKKVYDDDGELKETLYYVYVDGEWVDISTLSANEYPTIANEEFSEVEPLSPAYTGYVSSSKYNVENATISIPPEAQGMILSANPAYLSVKSMPLYDDNSDIDFQGANTTLKQGDALEVELDPVKSSVFSIYRHTQYDASGNKINNNKWRRYPLVGINANGQFYSNAVENGESNMGIGLVGAFQDGASNGRYIGASFGYSTTNLLKFYIDSRESNSNATKTLYLSTGTSVDTDYGNRTTTGNEYPRSMKFYGKDISLYAPDSGRLNQPNSTHFIKVSQTEAALGHFSAVDGTTPTAGIYFNAYSNNDSSIISPGTLNVSTNTTNNLNVTTGSLQLKAQSTASMISFGASTDSNVIQYNNQSLTSTFDTNYTVSANSISLNGAPKASGFNLKLDANSMTLGKTGDTVYLKSVNTNAAELYANSGLTLKTNGTDININSQKGPIYIYGGDKSAVGTPGLSLIPNNAGSTFYLRSGCGSLSSGYTTGDSAGTITSDTHMEIQGNLTVNKTAHVAGDTITTGECKAGALTSLGNIWSTGGDVGTASGNIYTNNGNVSAAAGAITGKVVKASTDASVGGDLWLDGSSSTIHFQSTGFKMGPEWCVQYTNIANGWEEIDSTIKSLKTTFNDHKHSFSAPSSDQTLTVYPTGQYVSASGDKIQVTVNLQAKDDDGNWTSVSVLPSDYNITSIDCKILAGAFSGTSETPNTKV